MKKCTLAFVILALAFSATIFPATFSTTCLADDFDWTGGGGDNNWNNGANWTNTTPAGTETIPDADDNVSFALDATTGNGSANNLTNSAIVTTTGNTNITLSGSSSTNTGTLTFVADNSNNNSAFPDTRYTIDSAMSLMGGGSVVLTGTETGFSGSGTLTNVDNVIRGVGQLQVNIINQNTIQAEGGVLSLIDGITLNNSSGQVALAADGELSLGTSVLEGGTLAATAGSLVRGGALKNVTVTGTLTERINNNTNWKGAITNQGTLTFTADNSNNNSAFPDTRYTIDTFVTLDGGGVVELTGSETGLTGAGLLTNVDNTIRGFGQMQVALNNQGTVQAQGGSLKFLDGVAIDNAFGVVQITATGVLDLGTSQLSHGSLSALAGSAIAGGTLADIDVAGTLTQAINRNTIWEGTITNLGTVTFTNDTSNNFGGVLDTRFHLDTPVTLDGGGTIVLMGSQTGLDGSGTLSNVDNTIEAGVGGVLDVDIQNGATAVISIGDGKLLQLNATVSGGTLTSHANGLIRTGSNGKLKDLTVTGTLTNQIHNGLLLEGTITNQGVLTMVADSSNSIGGIPDTRYAIETPVTLTGGGEVVLTGTETGFTGAGVLTNVNNTIRGFGQTQVALNNQSTVQAQGGSLRFLDGVAINNTSGLVQIATTGVLDLGTSRLSNGTLSGVVGGMIAGGTLVDVNVTGTLTQALNRNTFWEGTITNNGTITFVNDNSNGIGGVLDTRFHLDTPVTLNGGGTIVLTGSETGLDGSGTLSNVDNTIEAGDGAVLDVDIENGVTAVVSIGDGKLLQLNATVSGGTLTSHANGLIRTGSNGKLKDLTVTGTLTSTLRNGLLLEGTITNQGVLTMVADSSDSIGGIPDTRYAIETPVTLTGGGEVVLTGTETGFTGAGVLTNVNNTIRGFGQIQVQTVNQGTIAIEGGTLSLESGITIDNSAGSVSVAADGNLNLGSGTLRGGSLSATLGSIVRNGTLEGVTLTGTLTQSINRGTTLAGTITNQGVLTFTADGSNSIGGIPDTRFSIDTTVTLTGGGEVILNGVETGLSGNGLLTNANHTIRGFGQLQVKTVNDGIILAESGKLAVSRNSTGSGEWQVAAGAELEINTPLLSTDTITVDATGTFDFNGSRLEVVDYVGNLLHEVGTYAPGQQTGISTLTGDLQMGAGAVLEIQFSGDAAGEFDQLQVSGTATVDGALQVRAIDSIGVLSTSVTFTGFTAGSLEGTFNDLPVAGDHLGFGVFLDSLDFNTTGDFIEISASQILFPGDFDEDGDVDNVDFMTWENGYGATSGAALADGDADADGDVDGRDYLIWQRFRGSVPPLLANTNVPEPSTALLLLLALVTTRLRRARIRI